MIDLTVIVPLRHHLDQLATVLAHLEVQEYPAARFEVMVIDATPGATGEAHVERFRAGSPVRTRYYREDLGNPLRVYNTALAAAEGQWVLFLAEDLLAGPNLIAEHVRTHEAQREKVVVLGGVARHPQVPATESIHIRHPVYSDVSTKAGAVHYLDWRWYNLSLPRQEVMDRGGFCEAFVFASMADVELAYRLAQSGMQGLYHPAACAYAWRTAPFEAQRADLYKCGYSLCTVLQRVPNTQLYRRYALHRQAAAALSDRLLLPVYSRLHRLAPADSYLRSFLNGRVLHCELQRGFRDAVAERAPHLP